MQKKALYWCPGCHGRRQARMTATYFKGPAELLVCKRWGHMVMPLRVN